MSGKLVPWPSVGTTLNKARFFLAHLSRRLTGKLIIYKVGLHRPVSIIVCQTLSSTFFIKTSPQKPPGQSKTNFIWSFYGMGEWKFVQMVLWSLFKVTQNETDLRWVIQDHWFFGYYLFFFLFLIKPRVERGNTNEMTKTSDLGKEIERIVKKFIFIYLFDELEICIERNMTKWIFSRMLYKINYASVEPLFDLNMRTLINFLKTNSQTSYNQSC